MCDLVFAFWVVFSWWVSFLVFVRRIGLKGDMLKLILLFKIEKRVLKDAGDCSDELDRLLSCFSLVQFVG